MNGHEVSGFEDGLPLTQAERSSEVLTMSSATNRIRFRKDLERDIADLERKLHAMRTALASIDAVYPDNESGLRVVAPDSASRGKLAGMIDSVLSSASRPLSRSELVALIRQSDQSANENSIKSTLSGMKSDRGWGIVGQKKSAKWFKVGGAGDPSRSPLLNAEPHG